MKNIRLTALLLTLALLLSALSGCGGETNTPGGTVTPNPTEATTEPTTAPTTNTTEKSEGDLGRMEGGTYTNKYTGYSITLDNSWTYYTAKELQALPENVKELFSDSELADQYNAIADMMAESATALASINVQYQKLSLNERLTYATMSNEALVDSMLQQKDFLVNTYTSAGMRDISMEKATVTFLGESRTVLKTTFTNPQGVVCYIAQVQQYSLGAYGVTLTVTTYNTDTTQTILNMFKPA